jgi:hypothetical protein
MNPLPQLPLVDGNTFLIDNSGLELLRCSRLFELQFLRKRVKVGANAGANFGSTCHAGWAVRYHRCNNKAVKSEDVPHIQAAMKQWLDSSPQPLEDFRDFNHACRVMEAYNEHYGDEDFEIISNQRGEPVIENSFAYPFGTVKGRQIVYTGKIDLGVRDRNGIWSFDHKTAFQFGKGWEQQMMMDAGQLGYAWALKQTTGVMPMGYIIDGVRIRRPKREDEYKNTAPCDASDLMRIPVFLTPDNLDEWYEDTVHLIERIFEEYEKGYFPRFRSQCVHKYGACDFYDVCSVSRGNRQAALDSNMFEENKWSPLKEPIAST